MERAAHTHYSATAKVIYWLTAIVVLAAFIYGPDGSEGRNYSPARDFDRRLHESLGVCVLALVLIRILHELGTTIAEVHSWLGDVVVWIAGIHAAAGLFHHYVLKDGVLLSMLPRRGSG